MPSITSLQRLTGRGSSARRAERAEALRRLQEERARKGLPADSARIAFDLVTQLTYMACLAVASLPRDRIIRETSYLGLRTSAPFWKVFVLAKGLAMNYARAFELVAEEVKATALKNLLLRFAASVATGESERDFLYGEWKTESEKFVEYYERALESLKKWTDAYSAVLVSVSLILVVGILATMITQVGPTFLLVLAVTILAGASLGAYLIHRVAPSEVKTYTPPEGAPPDRRRALVLGRLLLPLGTSLSMAIGLWGGVAVGLLAFSAFLLPVGFFAWRDNRYVGRVDEALPGVIRAIGSITTSIGGTLGTALARLDTRSMGFLEPLIRRMQVRLSYRISPGVVWERFVAETGSEVARRTVRAFADSTRFGADAQTVGQIASEYALMMTLLRAKRAQVSQTFIYLVIPLHLAMSALMVFILQVVVLFNEKITRLTEEMGAGASRLAVLPLFQPRDTTPLTVMATMFVVFMALVNAFTLRSAEGGHPLLWAWYASFLSFGSGLCLYLIPRIAPVLFPG